VPADRIVKGFDLGGGEYVLLSDEELESAEPTKSHLIEITDFVGLEEIDPVFYRATYYLAPEGEAAGKAYALLREVMRQANKVAIGTVVMRNKEYPVAIRPDDEVLKLETMYFADEIRSPARDLPDLPAAGEVTERETAMAGLLLESMESAWDPDRYHDGHRQKVEALIEAKRHGDEIVTGVEAAPVSTRVVDLMDVLSASVHSINARKPATGTASKQGRAAKKAAAPTAKAATSPKPAATRRPAPVKKVAKAASAKASSAKATAAKASARDAAAKATAKPAARRRAS
jgi:DNA end-binding protein Ku